MESNLIKYAILFCLLALSLYTDLKESKIRNKHIAFFALAGVTFNFIYYGVEGLNISAGGILIPVMLLGIFFCLRLIGAGDIKLFSAIGALLGWKCGIYIMAYSFLFAGIISFAGLLRKREIRSTFSDFYGEIRLCIYTKNFIWLSGRNKKHIIRLSPAIAMGVCFQLLTGLY